jgi:hypothetical protein
LEYDVDVSGVGAMDVSAKRSAAEFGANVIARNDDRATTMAEDVNRSMLWTQSPATTTARQSSQIIVRSERLPYL